MSYSAGFGVGGDTNCIKRDTKNSVQVADRTNNQGSIIEQQTYGATTEVTEEVFVASGTFTNEATEGQTGTTVVTGHDFAESNTDFKRATKVTRTVHGSSTSSGGSTATT